VVAASKKFRQGDLLIDVPFGFLARRSEAITTEAKEELEQRRDGEHVGVIRSLPFAIIATQTCDLQQESRVRESPFINVLSVYDAIELYDEDQRGVIKKEQYKFLVPLDGQALQHDGAFWIADARIDICIDRAELLKREPLEALSDALYVQRCRMISGYRARPALSDELLTDHIKPLEAFVKKSSWRKKIKEVWVRCTRARPDLCVISTITLQGA
jgi:hypothetical protein